MTFFNAHATVIYYLMVRSSIIKYLFSKVKCKFSKTYQAVAKKKKKSMLPHCINKNNTGNAFCCEPAFKIANAKLLFERNCK